MDVTAALRARRMTRSFDASPLDPDEVDELLSTALRAPSAGNSRGIGWVSLIGKREVERYFAAATDDAWRASSPRAEGLARASAIGLCLADPAAYVARYAAEDKVTSGLGAGPSAWPIPYWIGDAGATVLASLLLAEERGWAACFLGTFRRAAELRAAFSIPPSVVIYGAVLLGRADGADHPSRSLDRRVPTRASLVRRGRWS